MVDKALTKRVKRHVIGPVQSFFAATAPGLERLCYREVSSIMEKVAQVEIVPGGVTFKGRLTDMYGANLNLRTPTRILMRIAQFKASNFRQLKRHLLKIPWELHIIEAAGINISATSARSRLYHSAAVAERVKTAIHERLEKVSSTHPVEDDTRVNQNLLVRVLDDTMVISLDSSGEPLYKRGLKKQGGRAPLRENLAAAALLWLGYSGGEPLLDPMCGSGTFSLEAALISSRTPPGWYRNFAFMNWPAFKTKQWQHLKKKHSLGIAPITEPSIFASDKDPGVCASLSSVVQQYDLFRGVSVMERDFFNFSPDQCSNVPGIAVLNPPYGIRLESTREARRLYTEIAAKLSHDYRKWRVGVLLPDRGLAEKFPPGLKQRRVTHGGLNLTLLTGQID
jgi:putative N6-adenine-specific DNA methylase